MQTVLTKNNRQYESSKGVMSGTAHKDYLCWLELTSLYFKASSSRRFVHFKMQWDFSQTLKDFWSMNLLFTFWDEAIWLFPKTQQNFKNKARKLNYSYKRLNTLKVSGDKLRRSYYVWFVFNSLWKASTLIVFSLSAELKIDEVRLDVTLWKLKLLWQ